MQLHKFVRLTQAIYFPQQLYVVDLQIINIQH